MGQQSVPNIPALSEGERGIGKVVFQYLFTKHGSSIESDPYFVEIARKELPADFITCLDSGNHAIKPASEFRREGSRDANGVLYSIQEINFKGHNNAEVVWTLRGGKKWGATAKLELVKQEGTWRVVKEFAGVVE